MGSRLPRGEGKKRERARQKASGRTPPSPLQAKPTTRDAAAQHPSQAVGGVADRKPGTEAGRWEAGGAIKEQDPAKERQPRKTARLPSASLKHLLALLRAELSSSRADPRGIAPGRRVAAGQKRKPERASSRSPWSFASEHLRPTPVAGRRRRPLRMHLPG